MVGWLVVGLGSGPGQQVHKVKVLSEAGCVARFGFLVERERKRMIGCDMVVNVNSQSQVLVTREFLSLFLLSLFLQTLASLFS
jgi:hypothetical protein